MLNEKAIEGLTFAELIQVQRHLKFGTQNVLKFLSPNQLQELYSLSRLDPEIKSQLQYEKVEIIGPASLAINTILTGLIGGWMGVSAFIGIKLNSPLLFTLVMFASLTLGTLVGYFNYIFKKQSLKNAVDKRKLQNIEISIVNKKIQSKEAEIEEKTAELRKIFESFGVANANVEIEGLQKNSWESKCLDWLDTVERNIGEMRARYTNNAAFNFLLKEIENEKEQITKKLDLYNLKERNRIYPLVQNLLNAEPKPPKISKSWIRYNWKKVVIGILPAFMGTCSSLFVYINGMPQVAKDFGHRDLFHLFTTPTTKMVQVSVLILLSLYFAISFVYMNYKEFMRDRELAKADADIVDRESHLQFLDDKLLKIKEALSHISKVFVVLKVLKP